MATVASISIQPALSHSSWNARRIRSARERVRRFVVGEGIEPYGVLTNSVIAPGSKMLAKAGFQVAILRLADPTDGYDFDTIIVGGDEGIVITRADGA
jgi:hypothetical protein